MFPNQPTVFSISCLLHYDGSHTGAVGTALATLGGKQERVSGEEGEEVGRQVAR